MLLTQEVKKLSIQDIEPFSLPVLDVTSTLSELHDTCGKVDVFFNEEILKQVQNYLTLAQRNVKIAVSWFTNYTLFKQVKEIAKSGIKVQLITNNDLTNNGGYCLDFNELINAGVEISLVEYPHLVHHKFCIIDDVIVLNGSYNWTRFSAKNYENIMVISGDGAVVRQFTDEFEEILSKAEYKNIDKMPDTVPERPEYDRSAFRQYVTEELDAQARETTDERDKIMALQTAVKLNPQYMQKINPSAESKYADAFKVVEDSLKMKKNIVDMVDNKKDTTPSQSQQTATASTNSTSSDNTTTPKAMSKAPVTHVVTKQEKEVITCIAAKSLLMVLDVSGSMDNTYKQGHVQSITKKALSASLAISESEEVAVWTFGNDATFEGNVGVDNINEIEKIVCRNEGTELNKFVSKANPDINDGALVIIFTDDDSSSIKNAINGMKQRSKVFWQIIVCGSSSTNIQNTITNVENTSVVSLNDYSSKTDEEISQILLKDYINWKKQNS